MTKPKILVTSTAGPYRRRSYPPVTREGMPVSAYVQQRDARATDEAIRQILQKAC